MSSSHHSPLKPSLKIKTGRLFHSLKAARIENISLCESHLPSCVELIVNHTRKDGPSLVIVSRQICDDGKTVVITCEKGESNRFVELHFAGLSRATARLIDSAIIFSNMSKTQETILFTPRPRTEKQMARVGRIIAGA